MHYKLFSVKNVLSKHTISLHKKKFFIAFYIVIAILSATHLSGQSSEKKINILVYPFTNSGNAQYSWVSTGMTQSVISDLSKISSISVFTEEDRKKAIQEIELGMTGLVKESDVVKVGTIMGAQLICSGNYTVSGNRIRINAKLVSVEKATVDKAITLDGTIDNLFELQDRIVTELMSTAQQTTHHIKTATRIPLLLLVMSTYGHEKANPTGHLMGEKLFHFLSRLLTTGFLNLRKFAPKLQMF